MKIPVIKKLVEQYDIHQLAAAENALLEEQTLEIEVEGYDEGEKLTHVIAAQEILMNVKNHGITGAEALRAYTQRVRNSIS